MEMEKETVARPGSWRCGEGAAGWATPAPGAGDGYVPVGAVLMEQRVVSLIGPIDDGAAMVACAQLSLLARDSWDPVELWVCSPGGSLHAGLALVDQIRALRAPVHTVGTGLVASMAAVVVACGEPGHRELTPSTRVLVHQPVMQPPCGGAGDIEAAGGEAQAVRTLLDGLLADACNTTAAKVRRMTRCDTWMDAEGAVGAGLADAVRRRAL